MSIESMYAFYLNKWIKDKKEHEKILIGIISQPLSRDALISIDEYKDFQKKEIARIKSKIDKEIHEARERFALQFGHT